MTGTFSPSTRDRLNLAVPSRQLLSNGRYCVLLTRAGTGGSFFDGDALTRWVPDPLEDRSGAFFYLRDLASDTTWSLGEQPIPSSVEQERQEWQPGRSSLIRRADGLEARLDVCVSPDGPFELRRVTLTNLTDRARRLEVTSYAEVVLHDPAADAAHPAFSKLFVQTEWVGSARALIARRRPRAPDEHPPVLVHAVLEPGALEVETDRVRFVGRGRTLARPRALETAAPLSGTTGNVLDPIVSLRRVVELGARASASLTFVLGAAADRSAALALLERCGTPADVGETFERAAAGARATLGELELSDEQAAALQELAGVMFYGDLPAAATADALARRAAKPGLLRRFGLAGHRPFAFALLEGASAPEAFAELVTAQRYWQALGVARDLVLVCGDQDAAAAAAIPPRDLPGLTVIHRSELTPVELEALAAAARLELAAGFSRAPLPDRPAGGPAPAPGTGMRAASASPVASGIATDEPLEWFNGHGGFAAEGREYVVRMPFEAPAGRRLPPLPWVNVIANETFGCVVSETGAGSTWCLNSREHRLTPWFNDPLLDPHGEALYVRDEISGAFASAFAGPAPAPAHYEMRHGFGYSVARHVHDGLEYETCVFVPRRENVKVTRLTLTNRGAAPRRLALVSYQRLVLGVAPEDGARSIVTEHDADAQALLARHPLAGEFTGRVAFAASVATPAVAERSFSADRAAFVGAGGSLERPRALVRGGALDGQCGAGLDPCFAERLTVELAAGESVECTFLLGECGSAAEVRALLARLRAPGAIARELEGVQRFWSELVSGVQIATPAPALDRMVNGWLTYQTLGCRIWGRSALYQSGGAFGFRDQLQDSAALLTLRPDLARSQLLLHAAHQFVEGDVLHWWHPPSSKGIRTRFADDLLWLPLLTAGYVASTGDFGVLDERVRFLQGPPLEPGEDEVFLVPKDAGRAADLYEHCCRALDRSLLRGEHGLPLFGTGDWNDGMNRVGREGRGESVWMGFFLVTVIGDFLRICERRGDAERHARYSNHRDQLRRALEEAGWDGEWYRRGYYDDGTPLGTSSGDECRIDGLVQAWAVLSKSAPEARAREAMDAVERHLVSERDGLIRLLTPPFQNTPHDPGYIRGYVAGVRENGGQYTHGALWIVRAFAELGRRDRAATLLEMLSPISHTRTAAEVAVYQTEPYVIAADVYSEPPHVGRGGWTWYSGSAGWMLRVALETVLGFRIEGGDTLVLDPRVPDTWPEYRVTYRVPGARTTYEIQVRNPHGVAACVHAASVDGTPATIVQGSVRIPILQDGRVHRVEVELGAGPDPGAAGD